MLLKGKKNNFLLEPDAFVRTKSKIDLSLIDVSDSRSNQSSGRKEGDYNLCNDKG